MKRPIEYRCPKCLADRGVRCINLRWAQATGWSANMGYQRRTDVEDRGSPDDHRLKNPHKERVFKAKADEWSDPSMMQNAISNARRGE